MSRPKKYDYDIEIIEALQNEGLSVREIARRNNWNELNTQQWINRNYKKVVRYVKK
jgi:transposase|tara:strand:+ start:438 stop:605 length:168 start_codon:yes stop_codon:yes gene_type:complete